MKPGNIMLSDPLVKILDFGIAKLANQTTLTVAGASLGTAAYMSPEQAEGGAVDHRTDIWALGVVLFEMVTGERPFDVDSFAGWHWPPIPPRSGVHENCVPTLRSISRTASCGRCRSNPADRFQSMRDFVAALEAVRQPDDASTAGRVIAATRLAVDRRRRMLTQAVCEAFVDTLSVAAVTDRGVSATAAIEAERVPLRAARTSLRTRAAGADRQRVVAQRHGRRLGDDDEWRRPRR